MVPLKGPSAMVGVLAIKPQQPETVLTKGEKNLLYVVADLLAIYMEKDLYQERSRETIKLEASERLYQTILNSISHEIKTPMTAIIGLASTLENEQIQNTPQTRQQVVHELLESVDRLNEEVMNILDMSRLSSEGLALKKEWNDIQDIVDTCILKLNKQLINHLVQVNIPEPKPFLKVDFDLFESALCNILINAAQYAPAQTLIEIGAVVAGKNLKITVVDHGPGIPEEHHSRIFNKFYRLPGSAPGGTGLGLAIAKSVVELHGGSIAVKNQAQGGLEVAITLPYEEPPKMPAAKKT
jgi:two-component system, OmpR family, sensor histidine kinase KdpD